MISRVMVHGRIVQGLQFYCTTLVVNGRDGFDIRSFSSLVFHLSANGTLVPSTTLAGTGQRRGDTVSYDGAVPVSWPDIGSVGSSPTPD